MARKRLSLFCRGAGGFHQFGDLGDEAVPEHGAVGTSLGGGTSLGPEQTALRMLDAELHRAGCRPSSHTQQCGFQSWQILRVNVHQGLGSIFQ